MAHHFLPPGRQAGRSAWQMSWQGVWVDSLDEWAEQPSTLALISSLEGDGITVEPVRSASAL